jgi:hypothetical protein
VSSPEAGRPQDFDAEPILAVLERHGVDYVMVGGYAARMHGSQRPTRDVDVTPSTTRENLDRLAGALRQLDARIRTEAEPDGLPFNVSGESLSGARMLNLQTPHGELHLTIRPAAFEGGYDDLIGGSIRRNVGTVQVRVAAVEDVIRSKEMAGRRKDVQALPELWKLAGQARNAANFPQPPQEAAAKPPAQPSPAERIEAARRQAAKPRRTGNDIEL